MIGLRALRQKAPSAIRAQQVRSFARSARNADSHGIGEKGLQGAADNAFNRERAAVKEHAAATSDLWRKLSIYIVIPGVIIAGVNAYRLWTEHWEHVAHGPSLEEKTEYAFQNIRTKNYFFGDGDKTLFWNPKVNYHKKDE